MKDKDAIDFFDISLSGEEDIPEEELAAMEKEEREQEKKQNKERRKLKKAEQRNAQRELEPIRVEKVNLEDPLADKYKNLDEAVSAITNSNPESLDKRFVSGFNKFGQPILKFTEIFLGTEDYKYTPVEKRSIREYIFLFVSTFF